MAQTVRASWGWGRAVQEFPESGMCIGRGEGRAVAREPRVLLLIPSGFEAEAPGMRTGAAGEPLGLPTLQLQAVSHCPHPSPTPALDHRRHPGPAARPLTQRHSLPQTLLLKSSRFSGSLTDSEGRPLLWSLWKQVAELPSFRGAERRQEPSRHLSGHPVCPDS